MSALGDKTNQVVRTKLYNESSTRGPLARAPRMFSPRVHTMRHSCFRSGWARSVVPRQCLGPRLSAFTLPLRLPLLFLLRKRKANVINEIARTLKPGGKAVIVDATQPEFDGAGVCTLDGLPSWGGMTPTYRSYLTSDLEYGLIKVSQAAKGVWINTRGFGKREQRG